MLFLTVALFFVTGQGLLAHVLLKNLQSPHFVSNKPLWKKNNALVLLGGGAVFSPLTQSVQPSFLSYSRIYEAARQYFACKKSGLGCIILISGGDPQHIGTSEAAVYKEKLLQLGIKYEDILLEPNSKNTFKNAEFSSVILKKKGFEKIVLITSALHMKRSLLYFSHFGINATAAASDYISPVTSVLPSTYSFVLTEFALHEEIGILRFYIYNHLRWNNNPGSPSSF